jgi:hypothetical protein
MGIEYLALPIAETSKAPTVRPWSDATASTLEQANTAPRSANRKIAGIRDFPVLRRAA